MRIVGGRLRGRTLTAPDGRDVRPTSDRTRQALFNILEHASWAPDLAGVQILDAFCGSGALAFEALSRGAKRATLLDAAQSAITATRKNAQILQLENDTTILRMDATKPTMARLTHDLVFLDPPYDQGLIPLALKALFHRGWIAANAVLVLETRFSETLPPAHELGCVELDQRSWGEAAVTFWQMPSSSACSVGLA